MSETILNDTTEYTRYIIDDKVVTIIGRLQDERNDCGPVGIGVADYVTSNVNNDRNAVIMMEYKDPRVSLHGIDSTVIEDIYPRILNDRQIVPFDYRIFFLGQKNEYRLYRQYDVINLKKKELIGMYVKPFFDKYRKAFRMREDLYPEFFLDLLKNYVEDMSKKLTEISRSIERSRKTDVINDLQRFWTALPTFYILREIFRRNSSKNIFVMAEGHYDKIVCVLDQVYLENDDLSGNTISRVSRKGECISVDSEDVLDIPPSIIEFKPKRRMGASDLYRGLPQELKEYMVDEYVDLPGIEAQIVMVKEDPERLEEIRDPHPDVSMAAVKEDGYALQFVKNQTPEIVMAAVKGTPNALQFVREDLKTPELCMVAVKKDGRTLEFVDLQTPEIVMAAVKQTPNALKFANVQTTEIATVAVKKNGLTLRHVREDIQTAEIAMAAVKQNGLALMSVRKDLRTPEIAMAAVKQNGRALRYVRDDLQTPELVMVAVKKEPFALRYVRVDLKTPELVRFAEKIKRH